MANLARSVFAIRSNQNVTIQIKKKVVIGRYCYIQIHSIVYFTESYRVCLFFPILAPLMAPNC